ncbi:Uncharacterized protein PBTT_07475 [Plasmodiophora brassicae]|uniref:Uncharacterized protein n=1 Tax=Plasmodiophora brassicae TaxID=37360 RepID=A0A3P3YGN3_PLABS|nr:unnamed protein product [Plasmodiophora brassicae]
MSLRHKQGAACRRRRGGAGHELTISAVSHTTTAARSTTTTTTTASAAVVMEPYSALESNFQYDAEVAGSTSMMAPFQPIPQFHGGQQRPVPPAAYPSLDIGAVPREANPMQYQIVVPEMNASDGADCVICGGAHALRTMLDLSFTCSITSLLKNLREKPNSFCFTVDDVLRLRIPFKVYAASTIKRGRSLLRRGCMVFVLTDQILVHIYCRTPLTGRGSIKWTPVARESFLAFEDEMTFTLRVMTTDPQMKSDVRISVDVAPDLLHSDRLQQNRDDSSSGRQRDSPEVQPAALIKKVVPSEYNIDKDRTIEPDLNARSATACRGHRIASYSFRMHISLSTAKNLRQRASAFDIIFDASAGEYQPSVWHLKWKVYADSTIKRGRKALRRNDFVFPIPPDRVIAVYCKSPSEVAGVERCALKWTEEKQESFLAFESGLMYTIVVYSMSPGDKARVFRILNDDDNERITEWVNDLDPTDTSQSAVRASQGVAPPASTWQMEPSLWNMTSNPGDKFYAMIVAPEGVALPEHPIVEMHAHDKQIQIVPVQVDQRQRRSMLIAMPIVFSQERVEEAAAQGVTFSRAVDLSVLDASGSNLWTTTFTYELGDPA